MPDVLQTTCRRLYEVLNEVWCTIDMITATLRSDAKEALMKTEVSTISETLEGIRTYVRGMHSESPYLCRLQEIRDKSWIPVCAEQVDSTCEHIEDKLVKMLASLKRKLQQIDCLFR
jgi:hypothetical protein